MANAQSGKVKSKAAGKAVAGKTSTAPAAKSAPRKAAEEAAGKAANRKASGQTTGKAASRSGGRRRKAEGLQENPVAFAGEAKRDPEAQARRRNAGASAHNSAAQTKRANAQSGAAQAKRTNAQNGAAQAKRANAQSGAAQTKRKQARPSAPTEHYDDYDLPRETSSKWKRPRTEVYDEYDQPQESPSRKKRSREVDAYDEYDQPQKSASSKKPSREADAYDEYDRPSPKKRKSGGGRGLGAVNFALALAIVLLAGIGVWRTLEYRALAEMKALVSRQTFYPGTTVEGIDVSEMTLPEAIDYWERQIEPGYRDVTVTLDDGTSVTAAQLGYASDYERVLTQAWSAGRSGSLEQRYLRASAGSAKDYGVERTGFDETAVRNFAAWVASRTDAAPQDAHVAAFNTESFEFEFSPEADGYQLDQEALARDVASALSAGGGTVSRSVETLKPELTASEAASQYGMITSATTNASSSSSNRISNIRLAMSIINGTCLHPGEQFSFNKVVGERTKARGFKVATAYSSGTVTEEVGGGICQVSTTLFNAAVKADLKIDERHPHSLTVSYVDLGKDAAVDWGNKDLKFTNNTQDDVYILCNVSDDKRLHIGIFGRLLPNGESITVEGVKTGEVDYETQYQLSFELYGGQTRQLQKGKKGYTAEAYKIRWDADGNQISRDLLCRSRYSATPEIIEYGPQ